MAQESFGHQRVERVWCLMEHRLMMSQKAELSPVEGTNPSSEQSILRLQGQRLQLINICAVVCVGVIWTVEAQADRLNSFDQFAYPPMVTALIASFGLLLGKAITQPWQLGLAKALTIGSATGYVLGQAQVAPKLSHRPQHLQSVFHLPVAAPALRSQFPLPQKPPCAHRCRCHLWLFAGVSRD
jgi:hypothetical protein